MQTTTATFPEPARRDIRDVPLLAGDDHFTLAAFGFNNRGGMWFTSADEAPVATWEETKALALEAEAAGFEALIPNARWKGFGGRTDFNAWGLESLPWAASLAAVTSRIQVFATVHVPTIHPVRAAKEAATIDHVSNGRFGLNVVAGWNADELAMFGLPMRDHPDRYGFATEWMELVEQLWTRDEEFDYEGQYFPSTAAFSLPKPVQSPRPVVMSAAISEAGRRFAARFADINFMVADDPSDMTPYVRDLKAMAREQGRDITVMTQVGIVCADTEKEAKRRFDHYIRELGDWEAVRNFAGINSKHAPDFAFGSKETRVMVGHFATPLVGTPEQIVEGVQKFHKAGISGMAINWVDYREGIQQFAEQIGPLMVDAGLRRY
jgi:alkanesulfonate monooxygenase SsuD/methylene tetrahydromethanopterin reductase-like flavin-dependent oxidoreductase (luciferase family)